VNRKITLPVGLVIAAFGAYLAVFPLVTAEALGRPATGSS